MHDLVIVGAGPAGMTAAIYAQRYGIQATLVDPSPGGVMVSNSCIENYPGLFKKSGHEIAAAMQEQARELGAKFIKDKVTEIHKIPEGFKLTLAGSPLIQTRTIIIATGLSKRQFTAKNSERFTGNGNGIHTSINDLKSFTDLEVAVVGGGDATAIVAVTLARVAKAVHIICRTPELTVKPRNLDKLRAEPKIHPILDQTVAECTGSDRLEAVKLSNGQTLPVQALVVETGYEPRLTFQAPGLNLKTDPEGYLQVDDGMATSEPGIFAAGDLTTGSNREHHIVNAVSEGAISSSSAKAFLRQKLSEPLRGSNTSPFF